MSSWVLATLGTLGFFGIIALILGWAYLTVTINNVYVASAVLLTPFVVAVLLTPFVVAVFTLAYFVAESL